MKTRRVIITVEVETILPTAKLLKLRDMRFQVGDRLGSDDYLFTVGGKNGKIKQVQVNVVKPEK